jgi:hypothetical protein
MTARYSKKEWAFFYACMYLSALFVSTIVLWWTVLFGGNPMTWKSIDIIDASGAVTTQIRAGDRVAVRSNFCSSREVGLDVFPTLRDQNGVNYPLPSYTTKIFNRCNKRTYGFTVPDVPPGEYVYSSTIKYQANLIGRDEMTVTQPLNVRVD